MLSLVPGFHVSMPIAHCLRKSNPLSIQIRTYTPVLSFRYSMSMYSQNMHFGPNKHFLKIQFANVLFMYIFPTAYEQAR